MRDVLVVDASEFQRARSAEARHMASGPSPPALYAIKDGEQVETTPLTL
jgi:hypothetical protein